MHTKIWHSFLLLAATSVASQAAVLWTLGIEDNAWPLGLTGGGANAAFVQEQGVINPLPGVGTNVATVPATQSADNDYYFAGTYTSTIPSAVAFYGAYAPIGIIAANEGAAERAHAGGDLDLRVHFNVPAGTPANQLLTLTFNALNLDDLNATNTDPRFGNEFYFNGVKVMNQVIVRAADLAGAGTVYTSLPFTLASVNGVTGPGADNIVSLKGISYNGAAQGQGGGNWMGVDYIRLDAVPEPTSAFMVLFSAMGLIPFLRRRRA